MCYGENEIGKMFETVELIVVAACEVFKSFIFQMNDRIFIHLSHE